ncbi:MAG: hypothetical protein U9Q79_08605 [Candidatus Hydrogenedentes bacterium]|nr:hypothetical protein [Candidatus Hydrogenedentota bacterium]
MAAAVWIVVTAALYYVRFSIAFYRDNQDAMNDLFEKLGIGFLVF